MTIARTVMIGERTVTRIGLGTNRLTDTAENREFLRAAVDAGVEMIDTAHLYTDGESERTIGALLGEFPENVVVATKGGFHEAKPDAQLRRHAGHSLRPQEPAPGAPLRGMRGGIPATAPRPALLLSCLR